MKCHEPSSNRKAEVIIKAEGTRLGELDERVNDDGTISSFVEIEEGQRISVDCSFSGTTTKVFFDLYVDGVLRNSISSTSKEKLVRRNRRHAKFDDGFYFDNKSIKQGVFMTRGLVLESIEKKEDRRDSVGLIEVRIAVLRYDGEGEHKLEDVDAFDTVATWHDVFPEPTYSNVAPTHDIRLVDVEGLVSKQALGLLRSRIKVARPGSAPWVVMKFFYRGKDAVDAAGMLSSPKQDHALDLPPIPSGSSESAEPDDEAAASEQQTRASTLEDVQSKTDASTVVHDELTNDDKEVTDVAAILKTAIEVVQTTEHSEAPTDVKAETAEPGKHENPVATTSTSQGTKRARSDDTEEPAAKKIRMEDIAAAEQLLAQRTKQLEERRKKRLQAQKNAEDAKVCRMAALQEQLEEVDKEIEEEERLEREAMTDRATSESALVSVKF